MATLKISDLSVGDWVGVRCGTKINAFKVEEIRFNNFIHKYVALLNNKAYGLPTTELHPIPITAEILEKNGFVKNGGAYLWSNKKHRVFVFLTEFSPSVDIEEMDEQFDPISSRIEVSQLYAHQLQHALRIAGVDKEINLLS